MTLALGDALQSLSDRELIQEIHQLAERERHSTARVIAALMELDARKLYLREGCRSLFTYCTEALHFSEHAAYGRIEAARAARRFPAILDQLADGSLTLTAVGLLASHLTAENHGDLLAMARHKSKRDVERIVAALWPLPAVPSIVRKERPTRRTCSCGAALTMRWRRRIGSGRSMFASGRLCMGARELGPDRVARRLIDCLRLDRVSRIS